MVLDQERLSRVRDLLCSHPEGLTISEISAELSINRNSLAKYLNVLTISGQVEMQSYGASRVYFLSQRVPISAMLSLSSDFIIVLNSRWRVLQVNEAILKFFGEKRENLVGKTIDDMPIEFLRNLPLQHLFDNRATIGSSDSEVTTQWKGKDFYFKIKVIPSVFDDGSQGMTLIIEDTTRQKMYEHQLAVNEARFRAIVEDQTELIARFLYDGHLTFSNDSFQRYFNASNHSDKDAANFFSIIHDMDQQHVKAQIEDLTDKNRVCTPEFRVNTIDGIRWIQWTIRAITDQFGSIEEYQGVGRDITERRDSEERISRYIAEMKFLSRSVMKFVKTSDEREVYNLVATNLKEIFPDAVAVLALSYSREKENLRLEAVSGDNIKNILSSRIGSDPLDKEFSPAQSVLDNLLRERNVFLEGGFAGDFFTNIGSISTMSSCSELDSEMGIEFGYIAGLISDEELCGCAVIFLPHSRIVRDPVLILTYLKQASIVLRRIQAERRMKKSEEQFRNICENSPFPISIISPVGEYLYVNGSFREIFGYDLSDLKNGKDWFQLAFPDEAERKEAAQEWISDLKNSDPNAFKPRVFTITCRDGSKTEILFRPVTMLDGSQFILYEDVTVRTESERMKNLLASIVQSTNDAIIGKTVEGRILSWNAGAERMYGFSAGEMIGKDIREIVPPDLHEELDEIHAKICQGESISHHETQRVSKGGNIIDVSIRISPILDQNKRIIGAASIVHDITADKAERRLRKVEETYRSLVDNINIGVYQSSGDPKGVFVWGNTSLIRILGYPSFDALKKVPVKDIFVDLRGRQALLTELAREGFVKNKELHLRKADGTFIWVRVTALADFGSNNKILFINGIVEDITERKLLEKQLALVQKRLDSFSGDNNAMNLLCRHALMGAGDSIALLDESGKIMLANNKFTELWKEKDAPEIEGNNIINLMAEEFRKDVMNGLGRALKSGSAVLRYSIMTSSGRVPFEARIEKIEDNGGTFLIAIQRPVNHDQEKFKRGIFR